MDLNVRHVQRIIFSYVDLKMIFAEFEFKCIGLLEQSFVSTNVG